MAAFTQHTELTQTQVWELETPTVWVEIGKVLNSIQQYLAASKHPLADFDDVCTVTVGDDRIVFTVIEHPISCSEAS